MPAFVRVVLGEDERNGGTLCDRKRIEKSIAVAGDTQSPPIQPFCALCFNPVSRNGPRQIGASYGLSDDWSQLTSRQAFP